MPQIFQVLRCYKCLVFQIHQTKKSNKFECKVCGEKQSIKRHYGIGTGKDCRLHVQRLNSIRGEISLKSSNLSDYDEDELGECKTNEQLLENNKNTSKALKRSKWTEFVDTQEEDTETSNTESMFLGDKEVVLELPQKSKNKKFKVKTKSTWLTEENSNTLTNISNSELEWDAPNLVGTEQYESESNIKHLHLSEGVNTTQGNPKDIQFTVTNKLKSLQKPDALRNVSKTSSKWAQFVEENEIEKNENLPSCELPKSKPKTDTLFSLCDDNDLDNVLDI